VKYSGLQPESISLSTLTEPENAINFIDWSIEQQGRFTATAAVNIARLIVLGKYLSIVEQTTEQRKAFELRVDELRKYRTTIGKPVKVADKSRRWISLRKLESVGLSIYPLNARRLSELTSHTRRKLRRDKKDGFKKHQRYAYRVLQSILVRLTSDYRSVSETSEKCFGIQRYRNKGKIYIREKANGE